MDPEPSTALGVNLLGASTNVTLFIVLLVALVLLSAFFSGAELAYTSLNRIRLKALEAGGNKRAGKVLKLIENYDRLLSTILIGNNIVNIAAASISTLLFVGGIMSHNPNLAATVATVVTTASILIFGEITPKSLAKDGAEQFAFFAYPVLNALTIVFTPLNAIFWLWKKLLRKIFKIKKETSMTEDELITMIEEAESEGELEKHESELIRSAIEFDDVDVGDIMIPRVKVVAIEDSDTMDEIAQIFAENGFSRLPVYNETIDSVVGIIHERDFNQLYRKNSTDINSIIQDTVCVSKNMKISDALRLLQKNKTHMAIVVDEFGGTSGIVTMEDILEELVGEIYDEHDEVEVFVSKLDEDTFVVSGSENFEDMLELLGIDCREEFDSTTAGGWITEMLRRIPAEGESFNFMGYKFEVTKATPKSVQEIKATKSHEMEEEEE